MAARRIQLRLPPAIRKKIGNWLADIPIEQMLVNQAKRRIDKGGDSEISYKRLWADTFRSRSGGRSYRRGGKPLLDTRQHIYNTLHGTRSRTARSVVYHLRGSLIAVYHQNGFSTKGPNYIPLTLRGRREHQKGADPRLEGLVQGVDYIIARRGVTVPPRPLFRLAPEDRREIIATIRTEIRRRTKRRAA